MAFFAGGVSVLPVWLSTANPLLIVILCALGFAICSFFAGLITKDYSWVDRMWSVQPVFYGLFYAWRGGFSPVIIIASGLIAVWGIRLTWNFASKGGYTGMEDYRWGILRQKINNPVLWQLFNLLFISFFQNALFAAFTLPMYYMIQHDTVVNLWFIAAAVLCALSILLETFSDGEQNMFQEAKKAAREGKEYPSKYDEEVKQGFVSSGLFSICRHPNYVGEMGEIPLRAALSALLFLPCSLLDRPPCRKEYPANGIPPIVTIRKRSEGLFPDSEGNKNTVHACFADTDCYVIFQCSDRF